MIVVKLPNGLKISLRDFIYMSEKTIEDSGVKSRKKSKKKQK